VPLCFANVLRPMLMWLPVFNANIAEPCIWQSSEAPQIFGCAALRYPWKALCVTVCYNALGFRIICPSTHWSSLQKKKPLVTSILTSAKGKRSGLQTAQQSPTAQRSLNRSAVSKPLSGLTTAQCLFFHMFYFYNTKKMSAAPLSVQSLL
jgi:hypothetical protein